MGDKIPQGLEKTLLVKEGVFDLLQEWKGIDRLAPQYDDLALLYDVVRRQQSKIIWEFGCGYSTLVLSAAIQKNKEEWKGDAKNYEKILKFWTHYVIETDNRRQWWDDTIDNVDRIITTTNIVPHLSPVVIGDFCGRVCHYHTSLPKIMPTFAYLDGPDPQDVMGTLHGFNFQNSALVPMSADLLFVEPLMWIGTLILVDGREANCSFLGNNFQRNWDVTWIKDGDSTLFHLKDGPFVEDKQI